MMTIFTDGGVIILEISKSSKNVILYDVSVSQLTVGT